jgi:hypothetical protein
MQGMVVGGAYRIPWGVRELKLYVLMGILLLMQNR